MKSQLGFHYNNEIIVDPFHYYNEIWDFIIIMELDTNFRAKLS
jgi:hypothetical protein